MKKSEVNKKLNSDFKSSLKPMGFKKWKYGFYKNIGIIYFEFGYGIVDSDNSFPTTFYYAIGTTSSGTILQKILPERYKDLSENRCSIACGARQEELFAKGQYPVLEYDIYTEEDAERMVSEVTQYLTSTVLVEWEENPTDKHLEEQVNSKPPESPNFSGLVLAKLVNNSRYEEIKQLYLDASTDWADWDREDLKKVISYLDSHQ